MSELTVREAQSGDVDAILDVAERGWRATYGDLVARETIDAALAEWYDRESTASAIQRDDVGYFVAVEQGTVLGYVSGQATGEPATLAAIYVDPDHWGEGVGTAMLERFEQYCLERGCETIEITVLADNEVGYSFYRTQGYDPVETRETELFGEQVTETLFRGSPE